MSNHELETLTRAQVRAALQFGGPPRPPLVLSLWRNEETVNGREQEWKQVVREFPDDCITGGTGCSYWHAPEDDPTYRWAFGAKQKPVAIPDHVYPVISDWSELDDFLAELPDPNRPAVSETVARQRRESPDKYLLIGFGHYFHQRLAYLRGLENLLVDCHDCPERLRKLMNALLEVYEIWAKRVSEAGADGVWAGDDFGTQQSLFVSPEMFRSLYKPFYCDLAQILHSCNLDFWLHSCGNVAKIIPDLSEAGVDALHPIQAGTMDDLAIAQQFGGKIAFWVGMDVQQIIPFGTTKQIRDHVENRVKTFYRPDGGLVLAAGNAILRDAPLENVVTYARAIRQTIHH